MVSHTYLESEGKKKSQNPDPCHGDVLLWSPVKQAQDEAILG